MRDLICGCRKVIYPRYEKTDLGDIIEVLIILVILVAGLFYTAYGLFDQGSVSGFHNRYYEARDDF